MSARIDQPPELSPEDRAYVEEKTRRMVAVAALRKIQRLVDDYRDGNAPIELRRPGQSRTLSPEERAAVPPHARRVAGFAAMLKVQQLVREYRERQEASKKAARKIALFFAALLVAAAVILLTYPTALHALFRMLS
jgi:predicted transcriptional regulator